MPALGSYYSQWKLSSSLLFKQKSVPVVELQQYKVDMERWHGAISSYLAEKDILEKAGREKGMDAILARHEVRVKKPSADAWNGTWREGEQ